MKEDFLVSIIVPTYKATTRLADAIDSLVGQTYNNIEIIIVDDNDPNSCYREFTKTLVNKYLYDDRVKYFEHPCNKNGAAARNTGIACSKGSFITFLDDDDVFYDERIERCLASLTEHPEYDIVYTDCDIYQQDVLKERRSAKFSGNIWRELLLDEGVLGTGSNIFLRRDCIRDEKGFDEDFLRYQDVEFVLRLLNNHKILALNEVLVRKNVEITNIPPYPLYKKNKEMIFKKFNYLINRLSKSEEMCFYKKQYTTLLISAIQSAKRKYISEAKNNLLKYGTVDFKTRIKCAFPKIYKWYLSIKARS